MRNERGVKAADENLAKSGLENLNAKCFTTTDIPKSIKTLYRALAGRLGVHFIKFLKLI
jgi:hypothetical protein